MVMRNWLRRENELLKGMPLLLIVDKNELERILNFIESES